jgi:CcmD family protein
MENLAYLFAAYTIIWAVIFGYIVFIYLKQKKLQQQIDLLKQSVEEPDTGNSP